MARKAVVEGEWINRKDDREFYREEFILGPEVRNVAEARVVIQNGLLTPRMQSAQGDDGKPKYPGYARWRTAQVVAFEETSEAPETSDINKLIMEATNLDAVPDRLDSYKTNDAKAKALQQSIDAKRKRMAKAKKEDNVQDQGYVD